VDSVAAWLNLALGTLTIVAAAGAGLSIATVRELRSRVGDLRGEIDDKDRRLTQAETDLKAEQTGRELQAAEIAALQRVVTGEQKLDEIRGQNVKHHAAATEHWQEQETLLRRILVTLERGENR
jgi:hypothetical protein